MKRISIVQPYIPDYRVPFFERLSNDLEQEGIKLQVVAGLPSGEQAKRGDSVSPPWLRRIDNRIITAFGRTATVSLTRSIWRNHDAVIFPHLGSSLDANLALAHRQGAKVGLWGHIASYTGPANALDAAIEKWQLRRADHVFAYTPSGASYARSAGVPERNVTAVMNTFETSALEKCVASIDSQAKMQFRLAEGIPDGPLVAYLGSLDRAKQTQLLAESLDVLWLHHPDVHVAIGGQGADAHLFDPSVRRGQVTMLGRVIGARKAGLLATARAIANPGRIGLLAVDALVAQRPIVTTRWPFHGPEVEYLSPGINLHVAESDPDSFAGMVANVAYAMPTDEPSAWVYPNMDDMVRNFSTGIHRMLGRETENAIEQT